MNKFWRELTQEEIDMLTNLLQDKKFQDEFFPILKSYKTWNIRDIILALLLWLGYGYAYRVQIQWQLKNKNRINAKSFLTFGTISGMIAFLNGFVPGSIVYVESCILAFISVAIDRKNENQGVTPEKNIFNNVVRSMDFPVVRYNRDGFPLVWNEAMEKASWYTYDQATEYFKLHGDVMGLIYKWKNLEKVQEYLGSMKVNWKGYSNVAFTMTLISWEEKPFLWTTFSDGKGGTWRFAQELLDADEIQKEYARTEGLLQELRLTKKALSETEEKAKKDPLTGAYNRMALNVDMEHHLSDTKERNLVLAVIDIDSFKQFNDSYGHVGGDEALKTISQFIWDHLHRQGDKLYRSGGDEFTIIIESDKFEDIIQKFNALRSDLAKKPIIVWGSEIPLKIKTSWGIIQFPTGAYISQSDIQTAITDITNEADTLMYWVKFYKKHLGKELLSQGKIQENDQEKNGLACHIYDSGGNKNGVHVYNAHGDFTLTQKEFEILQEKERIGYKKAL